MPDETNDVYDVTKGGTLELAEDTDGDGFPGVAFLVNGLVSGTRNVVQRDWAHYESDSAHPIPRFARELTARSDFRNQENILHIQCATSATCPLLEAGSTASLDTPGHVVFRYLGKTWDADPAQTLIVGAPGANAEDDLASCLHIQAAMAHDHDTGAK